MSFVYNFVFVSTYWQYIIAGIVCYISARFFYWFLGNKYNKIYGDRKGTNEYQTDKYATTDSHVFVTKYYPKYKDDINDEDDEEIDYPPFRSPDLQHVPFVHEKFPLEKMIERSNEFYNFMNKRRTVRQFSNEPIPIEIIRNIIKTAVNGGVLTVCVRRRDYKYQRLNAGTAPSGAHTEPWTYVVVESSEMKSKIREIIEQEEEVNYLKRMGKKWTTDLKFLRTNWIKEYLTDAPYLILVFKQIYSIDSDGIKRTHHYNEISINIAIGMLLTAVHYAGLVSLTSTPLNCGPALRALLDRPKNEKFVLLLPLGFPAENCQIPDLTRKTLDEILVEV